MAFKIADGYTLKGQTTGVGNSDDNPQPVLHFEYRPPTAEEMSDFRFQVTHATDGKQLHAIRVAFVKSRLVSWDFVTADDKPRLITTEAIGQLPDAVLLDCVNECAKWKPLTQDAARKN